MRVIAEFVDNRNGNRYLPGDGGKISPALANDQIARLKKAGCVADGDEAVPGAAPKTALKATAGGDETASAAGSKTALKTAADPVPAAAK